jgi:hypothetical protein
VTLDLTTEVVRTDRLVAGSTREGKVRSCLPYRDGTYGDAALFSRLPGD